MGDARFDAGTIEEYRERPIEFAYRTGLNHGIADGNADGRPRLFTREDCPAYRHGYIDGWATASIARKYNLDRATDEQRRYWVAEELRAITCFEAHNAECECISDVEARESWLETVEDIARVIGESR